MYYRLPPITNVIITVVVMKVGKI